MIRGHGLLERCAILLMTSAALGPASRNAFSQEKATSPAARPPDLRAMTDGPLHEAFLSPRRDVDPPVVSQSPPPPVVEQPGPEPPRSDAHWIGGYWEWSPGRGKFIWVTGSWRVPPPGRFWVNTFWKRDENGWRRIPGFWSDRATDRLVAGREGPPRDRPIDDSGAPPKSNCFYVPGQYVIDGDGVAWRKGFWADAKPGWSWTPATWTRQPEGWIFQEGYWDRPLEERGVLFAPAELAREPKAGEVLTYRPFTVVSPELFGQLYGAFGRSSSNYDGYPGVAYDENGRYFAYAGYGDLSPYYGYLDYPAVGGFGYPYYVAPIDYTYQRILPYWGGAPSPLVYGYGLPYYGFGNSILPLMTGYPLFGNLALAGLGWGWGWPGWGTSGVGWGNSGWSGLALGTWPGFNWGTYGWSGPAIGAFPAFGLNLGYPNWMSGWGMGWPGWGVGGMGWGGFGLGGFGLGGFGGGFGFPGLLWGGNSPLWANRYPFQNSGRHQETWNPGNGSRPAGSPAQHLANQGSMRQGTTEPAARGLGGLRGAGIQPPPATRPFAALVDHGASTARPAPAFTGAMRTASSSAARPTSTWSHAYNGVTPMASPRHEVARPAFTNNAGDGAAAGFNPRMHATGGARVSPGGTANATPAATRLPGWNGGMRAGAMGSGLNPPEFVPQLHSPPTSLGELRGGGGLAPGHASANAGGFGGGMRGGDFANGANLGSGFTGGMRQPGGYTNWPSFGGGVYNNGGMGEGSFSGSMRTANGFGAMRGGTIAPPILGGPSLGGVGGMRGGGMGMGGGGMRGGMGGGGMGGGAMGGGAMGGGMGGGHMR